MNLLRNKVDDHLRELDLLLERMIAEHVSATHRLNESRTKFAQALDVVAERFDLSEEDEDERTD